MGSVFGPTCTDGDRMGCGVDFNTDCGSGYVNVFFTKNGKQVRRGEEEKRLRRREGRGDGEERVSEENNTKGRWKRGEREEGTEEK